MSDHLGRIFGILAALAVLWILVYWWWEPRPRITFDNGPSVETVSAPGPREPVPEAAPRPRDTRSDPHPEPRMEARRDPAVAVIPPRFREYTVKKDDTVEKIARAELGSAKYAAAIREANALSDLERLKSGRIIRIPLDPTNVQGRPVAPAVETAAPPVVAGAPVEEYTVKSGDTLEKIARVRYGSIRFKDLIFEANRDRLKDRDRLRAGDKIRLPPKP